MRVTFENFLLLYTSVLNLLTVFLHVILPYEFFKGESSAEQKLGQAIFSIFFYFYRITHLLQISLFVLLGVFSMLGRVHMDSYEVVQRVFESRMITVTYLFRNTNWTVILFLPCRIIF
jgi:hypothetical protein